jgi:predicted DNA-binding transcriptional regulator YafY
MKLIYDALMAGRYPNSASLAVELETSPQTVKRDVDFMRDRWRLPIAYDAKRHGYYFTHAVESFPGLPVTQTEVLALMLAHKSIEPYAGIPLQRSLENTFHRWTRHLDPTDRATLETLRQAVSFRTLASEHTNVAAFDLVTRAIARRRALTFHYRKPGEKVTCQRHVHPYHLMAFEHRWYLLGHDVGRGEIRKFALGRMSQTRLLDEFFVWPPDFDPKRYLGASFGLMTGQADYEVTIEIDAWLTDVLRGQCWHPTQVWTELPGGGSRLQVRLSCLEEIEQWVMRWSSHVTVLGPTALVTRVAAAARNMLTRHCVA